MLRKKILLLGSTHDKRSFLKQLNKVENASNEYQVGSQVVEIFTMIEQSREDHICPQLLNGYDAAIQVINDKNIQTISLQTRIPDDFPSFLYFLGDEDKEPNAYIANVVLAEINKDKTAYRYQAPSVTTPGIASYFASLFFGSRKQQAACPVDHGSKVSIELTTFSSSHPNK